MKEHFWLTSKAEQDVSDIWLYIAENNLAAADRMADRFTEAFQLLAKYPEIGMRQDRYRDGLRAFSVGSYVVFYMPDPDGIVVYRVLHGARNIENLL